LLREKRVLWTPHANVTRLVCQFSFQFSTCFFSSYSRLDSALERRTDAHASARASSHGSPHQHPAGSHHRTLHVSCVPALLVVAVFLGWSSAACQRLRPGSRLPRSLSPSADQRCRMPLHRAAPQALHHAVQVRASPVVAASCHLRLHHQSLVWLAARPGVTRCPPRQPPSCSPFRPRAPRTQPS
jgi:hypothetical protein